MSARRPTVLTVAGSDPSGGAGLQADLKTFQTLGVNGASVVTVVTDCAAEGVAQVHPIPPAFIARQLRRVCVDYPPAVIKTGMLYTPHAVAVVARHLVAAGERPYVFDPVITTRRGETLVSAQAIDAMKRHLSPRCAIVTPSMPEAAALTGHAIRGRRDMEDAAYRLLDAGANAALVTGGHLADDVAADFFVGRDDAACWLEGERVPGALHGAGDCLSAGIAARLARRYRLGPAIESAKHIVDRAAQHAQLADGHPRSIVSALSCV